MAPKRLILMRHGKAERSGSVEDFQRALTQRGKTQSSEAAESLLEKEWIPDHILASSAKRAQESAQIVAETIDFPHGIELDQELYLCSVAELVQRIRNVPSGIGTLLVVGHNPSMEVFCDRVEGSFSVLRTAEMVGFQFNAENWHELDYGNLIPHGFLYRH